MCQRFRKLKLAIVYACINEAIKLFEVFSPSNTDAAEEPYNQFPILQKAIFFYKPDAPPPEWMSKLKQKIVDADAYIVVSGEYNHTIPPGLTNMIDHFPTSAFGYKPSGIVCYSPGRC